MEVIDAIFNRRSIRKFKNEKVKDDDIKTILKCAMMAPSACNTRPWEFIVIENEETKKELSMVHKYGKTFLNAPLLILIVARDDLQKNICSPYWSQDCAAVTENILLSSLSLGYGSCWYGVYPNEERVRSISKLLNIEKGIPFNIIAIGKADENPICKGKYEEDKVKYIK